MSEITLSKAVRSNLLNLQSTADLLGKSQERLSTGLRVNSALDNPTNFFTAQGLNSRASDLSQLLDAVSNAVQTVAAADKGISAITKLVESAQATARQALQTSNTVSTTTPASAGIVTGGAFTTLNVSGTGGSPGQAALVGTSAITPIDLSSQGAQNAAAVGTSAITPIDLSSQGATNAQVTGTSAFTSIDASLADVTFDINGETVTLNAAGGASGVYDLAAIVSAINTQVGTTAGVVAADDGNGNLQITSTGTAGIADSVTVDGFSVGTDGTDLGFAGATATDLGSDAVDLTFDVNGEEVTLAGGASYDGAAIASAINSQVGTTAGVSAAYTAGALTITSTGTAGASDSVTVDNFSSGGVGQLGYPAGTSATDAGEAAGSADSLSFTITRDGGSAQTVTINATTVGAYNTAQGGSLNASALTAANVASLINYQTGANIASVTSGGALQLSSTTTGATSSITTGVVTSTATSGSIGFSTSATDAGSAEVVTAGVANPKRAELVETYNDLLGQIDALAKDSGFNGVNLLNGDDLSVLFNEDGSSSLQISGISNSATGLGLTSLASTGFDSNASINTTLDSLKGAIDTLRTQASKFGSNLSVVETRQDFTKQMINVLQTGASNLTLADTNEEAANVLALQTRQQLSSTALSLASQADQNVLRLF